MIEHLTATSTDGLAIVLSPFLPDEAGRVFELCQDPDIQRWTTVPSPYPMEAAVSFVRDHTPPAWRQVAEGTFALRDEGPELVWAVRLRGGPLDGLWGSLGLKRSRPNLAEIGWWLGAGARGHGVMRAAVAKVLAVALDPAGELRGEAVWWFALEGNEASCAIAQRTGFTFRGLVTDSPYGETPLLAAVIHRGDPIAPVGGWPVI